MKSKSFTLIELLVVIVIIGILAGVIMISTSSSIDKASLAKAQAFSKTVQNELLLNLVSEWNFDNSSNLGEDTWGNNNGTITGADYIESTLGKCVFNGCVNFDSLNSDYIDYGNNDNLDLQNLTLSIWTHPNSFTSTHMGIIDKYPSYWLYQYGLNGNIYFRIIISGTEYTISGTTSFLNFWQYLAVVFDGKNVKIYQNGNLIRTSPDYSGSVTTTENSLRIGTYAQTTTKNWDGLIDDSRIYNSALSSSQIKQNYIAGLNSLFAGGNILKKEYNERIDQLSIK